MSISNFFDFVKENMREDRNNILVTTIGLIIVIALLTTTFTSDLSFKMDYVDQQVSQKGDISFWGIRFDKEFSEDLLKNEAQILHNLVSETAENHDLAEIISNDQYISLNFYELNHQKIFAFNPLTEKNVSRYIGIASLNRSLLDEVGTLPNFEGRLPFNPREMIFIDSASHKYQYEEEIEEIVRVGSNVTISIEVNDIPQTNFNVTIVGIYTPVIDPRSSDYHEFIISDPFIVNNPIIHSGFHTDHELFSNISSQFLDKGIMGHVTAQFSISLKEKATFFSLQKIVQDVQTFSTALYYSSLQILPQRYVPLDNIFYTTTYRLDLVEFENLYDEIFLLTIFGLLLMIPSLLIAIFFANFSTNMFIEQRKTHIQLIRLRGVSTFQLMAIIFIEGVFSLFFAFILGSGLGITINTVLLSLDIFFTFSYSFPAILLLGGAISGVIIISRMFGLSKLDIAESQSPSTPSPFWKQNKINFLLLAMGVIGNIFFLNLIFNASFTNVFMELGVLSFFFLLFLVVIFIPFPFFLLIGGIMMLSRLIHPILNFIAQKLWKRFGNLISYSVTNLTRQKFAVTKIILLFSLIFSISLAMFVVPDNVQSNNIRNAYYSVGADCFYDHFWNNSLEASFFDDPNIQSHVRFAIVSLPISPASPISLETFIVFPSFLDVGYFENNFVNSPVISDLLSKNLSVLVNEEFQDISKQKIGDSLSITTENNGSISLSILGSFNYWPRLIQTHPSSSISTPKLVISNETFAALSSIGVPISILKEGYYLDLSQSANFTAMKKTYGNYSLIFADELIHEVTDSVNVQILFFHFNVLFIISLAVIILAILFYGYNQLHGRTRELAVERSLGMNIQQLSRMFFYESLFSLCFSLVLGILLGLLFAISLLSIWLMVLNPSIVPPPTLSLSWFDIFLKYTLILVVGLFTSLIPATLVRKIKVQRSLRVI